MKIIAHRGFSANYPENTLLAFEKALESGVDGIETDLRLSRDGVVFVFHDSSLKRITGRDMPLEAQNSDYLETLDAGSWLSVDYKDERLPRLDGLLSLIDAKCQLILELKYHKQSYSELCHKVSEAIAEKLAWVEVSSFSDEILQLIHQLNPKIRVHKLIDEPSLLEEGDFDKIYGFASCFDIDVRLKDHPKTKELIEHKKVVFWTVDEEDISASIALGLEGAMSNDPSRLKEKYPS